MNNDINNLQTLKEVEQNLFQELQSVYQNILVSLLEELDEWLMNNRDFDRFENRERQKCTIGTMFGSVTINRRRYLDRETGDRVALLDQYLEFSGSDALSPYLTEMAVKWAVKGPSYRDARDRFSDLLGYQAMSHETIRQELLKIEPKDVNEMTENPKDINVLFLEVDGLHVHKQNSTRSTREAKIGVVHEGWEKKKDIADLRHFILENMDAFRDYRDILKSDKGINTEGMRPMGAAESNMNLFSRRLKKMGYSWSFEGLSSMLHALIHRFEGTLIEAIQNSYSSANTINEGPKEYPSFASLLTEKTRQSIGAIQGHMPALVSDDQKKPYIEALRGLAGL